jgi:hypothetical protein
MLHAIAAVVLAQQINTLSPREIREGWKLLFDGKSVNGWHNYRKTGVGPGWHVEDGILTSVNPDAAGDIVTNDLYDWFILELDFRLTKGGNSGVMLHCADEGDYMWYSGPEVQIYDDHGEDGAQKTGWLYDIYSSKVDSTKPPGEWNHFKIVVTKKKCSTFVNGTKYYDWVWGSKDFFDRASHTKFANMPLFGKLEKGTIGIQGDHGTVSFKNIKLKVLKE